MTVKSPDPTDKNSIGSIFITGISTLPADMERRDSEPDDRTWPWKVIFVTANVIQSQIKLKYFEFC